MRLPISRFRRFTNPILPNQFGEGPEKYLTISEICKIIDEAEWHYWNSHERNLSDEVWGEIYSWKLNGAGGEFAITYFEMIEKEMKIPSENMIALSSEQGRHLSRYKWN